MRKFKPGAKVRVEVDATIVKETTKGNPYWYDCLMPDGTVESVSISRIKWLADEPVATMDTDGSIQIISNRLTPAGARLLIDWLVAHERYFPDDRVEQETPTACTQDSESSGKVEITDSGVMR